MNSTGRSRRGTQLWEKAAFHFALCFVVGFFTGFTPSNLPSFSSFHLISYQETLQVSPDPVVTQPRTPHLESLVPEIPAAPHPPLHLEDDEPGTNSSRPLIIVTTTRSNDRLQAALLGRLAHTLRLVPPPLLWIVVEAHSDAPRTAAALRRTGILYRHLTFRENFTDPEAEVHHQRNVALSHIEHHRIEGIVHFAGVSNVYDLCFFHEIRGIEVLGAWPVAMASANRKPGLTVEGPVCNSSQVVGWYVKDMDSGATMNIEGGSSGTRPPAINIWGFGFNSSVLWDPERWGRHTSFPDTSQDSMSFVQQVVVEDGTKLKAIPSDCSQIMLWHLQGLHI